MNLKLLLLQLDYQLDNKSTSLKDCLTTLNEYNSIDYFEFINEKNRERERNRERNRERDRERNRERNKNNYIKNKFYTKIKVDEINSYKPRNFDAYLILWHLNEFSYIHNHPNRGCIFKVLTGSLKETRYTNYTLDELETNVITTGQTKYIHDSEALHKVKNNDENNLTISLHIYSPKGYNPVYFDIVENNDDGNNDGDDVSNDIKNNRNNNLTDLNDMDNVIV